MQRLRPSVIPDSVAATLQTLGANVAILAVNLGTGILTARLLGPAGRGELAAMVTWPQFLTYALTLGLPASLLYNLKTFPERSTQLFSASLLLGAATSTVVTLAGVILIPFWLTQYPREIVHFAQFLMVSAPIGLFSVIFVCALLAREEFKFYNAVRILQPFVYLLALVALAVVGAITSRSAALALFSSSTAIFTWMAVRLWRAYRPRMQGLAESSRLLTSYGFRAYGADLLGTFATQIDKVLLLGFVEPHMLGLYVVASSFSQTLNVVPTAFASVASAKCCGRPAADVVEYVGRGARGTIAATLFLGAGAAFFGPGLLRAVYGVEYVGAVTVLRILLFDAALRGTVGVLLPAFMALGRPGLVTGVQLLGLCVGTPALLVLVPTYGIQGAALGQAMSAAARLAMVLALFPVGLKCRAPRLWLMPRDLIELFSPERPTPDRLPA